ncbi:unnamed protein product, partial [Ixodes pacificus]
MSLSPTLLVPTCTTTASKPGRLSAIMENNRSILTPLKDLTSTAMPGFSVKDRAWSLNIESPATNTRGMPRSGRAHQHNQHQLQINQEMSSENNYLARSITLYKKPINDRECRFAIISGRYPKLAEGPVPYRNARLLRYQRQVTTNRKTAG